MQLRLNETGGKNSQLAEELNQAQLSVTELVKEHAVYKDAQGVQMVEARDLADRLGSELAEWKRRAADLSDQVTTATAERDSAKRVADKCQEDLLGTLFIFRSA